MGNSYQKVSTFDISGHKHWDTLWLGIGNKKTDGVMTVTNDPDGCFGMYWGKTMAWLVPTNLYQKYKEAIESRKTFLVKIVNGEYYRIPIKERKPEDYTEYNYFMFARTKSDRVFDLILE